MRASVDAGMSADKQPTGFRRQIVVRLDTEQWPLLESAAAAHGSIQRAVVAALQALVQPPTVEPEKEPPEQKPTERTEPSTRPTGAEKADHQRKRGDEEITAREAATLLGIKPDSVRGYIRSGRLPGRYDGEPTWRGWLTTRGAVETYRSKRGY